MEFYEWLEIGIKNDWCGAPVCETHDGFPMSEDESEHYDEHGEPPCMHMIRLYDSVEMKQEIEESHSPSVWRKTNMGL